MPFTTAFSSAEAPRLEDGDVLSRLVCRGCMVAVSAAVSAGVVAGSVAEGHGPPIQTAQAIFERAVADFEAGRLEESAAAFDRVAELLPDYAPQLWQRGIALYYVGRYDDCRAQFESHRTVNPNDVENAAWHFLCVARAESAAQAREALLPVGPDSRAPMTEIYAMFRGDLAPEQVLSAARDRPSAQFYAHLYVGLYYEASGQGARALENIAAAAAEDFAGVGGYMHMVARVHLDYLQRRSP